MPFSRAAAAAALGFSAFAAFAAWAQSPPSPDPSPASVGLMAAQCAACHGPGGQSPGAMPSLSGSDAAAFRQRLIAFRDAPATASATVMPRLMKGYSDAQIDALAQWFARPGAAR